MESLYFQFGGANELRIQPSSRGIADDQAETLFFAAVLACFSEITFGEVRPPNEDLISTLKAFECENGVRLWPITVSPGTALRLPFLLSVRSVALRRTHGTASPRRSARASRANGITLSASRDVELSVGTAECPSGDVMYRSNNVRSMYQTPSRFRAPISSGL